MSDIENQTAPEGTKQRAPWDAPQVVAVVPVGFTQGGFIVGGFETAIYYRVS